MGTASAGVQGQAGEHRAGGGCEGAAAERALNHIKGKSTRRSCGRFLPGMSGGPMANSLLITD